MGASLAEALRADLLRHTKEELADWLVEMLTPRFRGVEFPGCGIHVDGDEVLDIWRKTLDIGNNKFGNDGKQGVKR